MTPAADPAAPPEENRTGGWLLLTGIVIATLTEAVAGTALALGRFDILGDTLATPDEFAWLDISYVGLKLIGFIATPWLLTRFPARDVLLASTLLMGVACALAAFIWRLDVLIPLRAVQGLAGASVLVSGQALLFLAYPRARQPVLQALFATGAVVAPATLAPALQGWLVDSQSWTWIFLSVAPVALAAAGVILAADDVTLPVAEPAPFDGVGLALVGVGMLSLTYVLAQGERWDWFEAPRIVFLSSLALAALALLVLRRGRRPGPGLFDGTVFRSSDFTFACLVSFVAGAALLGSAYLIPTFAVSALAFTPTDAGLLLLPSGGLFVVSLLLSAGLFQARRVPPIATVPAGVLLFIAAMVLLAGANADSGAGTLAAPVLIRGFALGFLFLSITLIAFSGLPDRNRAYGIGLFDAGRQIGGLIGIAGLQTLLNHQVVANQTVLGANITAGGPAVGERIASGAAALAARGLDPAVATKTALAGLARSISGQATAIAFDTAFLAIALMFVVAAPLLIASKIGLARFARRRAAALPEEA
ncbi:MAG: MFS transporter [Alphaproteobacteria bacterium]|nr:MFS transporter [Alphaproteobacteria bacterium]MBU1516609.1 MFS transporter [Alphaproteobacteria bacterium]MBU2094365.1 MFS transporter [Alphaproteobacteria bacterium]MBU2153250.1 MFS transporter [Alphaproteobacteria bacterium]MBU2307536.1 MFS transporter [Alphaproteobacteria bacterium]